MLIKARLNWFVAFQILLYIDYLKKILGNNFFYYLFFYKFSIFMHFFCLFFLLFLLLFLSTLWNGKDPRNNKLIKSGLSTYIVFTFALLMDFWNHGLGYFYNCKLSQYFFNKEYAKIIFLPKINMPPPPWISNGGPVSVFAWSQCNMEEQVTKTMPSYQ